MKFSLVFAALATVSSLFAPVASAPLPQTAIEKRASSGRGTYYDVGLGACGKTNKNSQPIIAVNHVQFSQKLCGKWLTVKNSKNGKSARGYIEDMCPGCKRGDLDLSPMIFKKLAPLSQGVVAISWGAPSSKRSEDGLVLRAGTSNDEDADEPEDPEDPDYKFDDGDALTEAELEELLNAGGDDSEETEPSPASS
ncbi:hypothetical protein FRB90_000589 [Tulasnella sp. 427]|nr:hypothetical protein FRB90_000589 [Tulasnella sp. 427]